ncbi:hypothetical protein MH117_21755 [Paenibacillus sp. ACRRX]|uniref:hypothetical protein n=1 Tax=unclassified Paenibacillus TaxID=185978 RepID=UPI001EF72CE2|nr:MULTISPECIES: hypothetical protein [unclassified Paenibacillus]MCG7410041.1 hypothetical protein [Paenibacillus sp. ACRRX]MDK8183991.1 hypothetical protein [Paenibacillus sp. UMB4589-SE434]
MKYLKRGMFILLFVLLTSLPLIFEVYVDYSNKNIIKIGLEKLYKEYCNEVVEVTVNANLIQESGFMFGYREHKFYAVTSSKRFPSVSGDYGKKNILISEFGCSNEMFRLDKDLQRFIPRENFMEVHDDKGGIPIEIIFVYVEMYLIIIVSYAVFYFVNKVKNVIKRRKLRHNSDRL